MTQQSILVVDDEPPMRKLLSSNLKANGYAVRSAADIRLERPPIQHTRIDPVAIRHALEAVLASNELPPPSIRLVADRLGQTYANLHHYFPEHCRSIASRHRSYQEAQSARTRTRLRERVRDAAIVLTHRGLYPSASHSLTYSAIAT